MAQDQALLKNAQLDLERYRTLLAQDSIAKQQVDTQEALVRQYEGTVKADQGGDRQREAAAHLQPHHRADRRHASGCARSIPATSCTRPTANGLVVDHAAAADHASSSRSPRTTCRSILQAACRPAKRSPSRPATATQKVKLATGKLLTVDNQIDTTTGTVKLKAEFANADRALFPNQFVNVRMLVETHDRCDARPVGGDPARRAGHVRLRGEGRPDRRGRRRSSSGPVQGETTAIASGRRARRRWSSSTAPTSCAKARRSSSITPRRAGGAGRPARPNAVRAATGHRERPPGGAARQGRRLTRRGDRRRAMTR